VSKSDHTSEAIARLLGPAQTELSCEQCFEQLDRYVEFELGGVDAEARIPGMRPHLEGCAACAEDYESLKALVTSSRPPADTA
jgi:hypothetical protein